jgi:hypothetical protein
MRLTPQAAASIAPERFPPTPHQAAATLRSLLPPGWIVSDVRSNPGKTGGAAVDIEVDTGAGAHTVMVELYSAGPSDGLDCDPSTLADPAQTCTLMAPLRRLDAARLDRERQRLDRAQRRTATRRRCGDHRRSDQPGRYRTSPLLRHADQRTTLPHHGPTRRHRHQRGLVTAVIAPSRSARRRLSPDPLVRQDDHTRGSHRSSLASGSRVGPVCHCRTAEWNDVDLRGYTTGTHESRKRPYQISPYQRMPASKFGTCKHLPSPTDDGRYGLLSRASQVRILPGHHTGEPRICWAVASSSLLS